MLAAARTSRLPRPASPENVFTSAPIAVPSRDDSAIARVISTARGPAPICRPSATPSAIVYAPASADASSTPARSREPYTRSVGGALSKRRPSATTSSNTEAHTIDEKLFATRSSGSAGPAMQPSLSVGSPSDITSDTRSLSGAASAPIA